MKTSIIRYRVADFLSRYPPFDSLPEEVLLALAGSGRVQFLESETYVHRQGQEMGKLVWVIQQGAVELLDEEGDREVRKDLLAEGDLVGVGRFLGRTSYSYSARTTSDVILYALDAEQFEGLLPDHPRMGRFLTAHLSASGRYEQAASTGRVSWMESPAPPAGYFNGAPARDGSEVPEAAAGGQAGDYFLRMLALGSDALRVSDGQGPPTLMTDEDLALFAGWNPVRLAAELRVSREPARWRPLLALAARMSAEAVTGPSMVVPAGDLATRLMDAFLTAVLDHIRAEMPAANENCLLWFGPGGRGEALELKTPEMGLVGGSDAFAARIAELLGECGLPATSESRGVVVAGSLDEWMERYRGVILDPIGHGVYGNRSLFDARAVGTGDAVTAIRAAIRSALEKSESLLPVLANDTLASLPPLTFFQGLVVELDGELSETLDLTRTSIGPLVDAARVLALAAGAVEVTGTVARFGVAAEKWPEAAGIMREAASAFRVAWYYRFQAEQGDPGSGGLIRPHRLTRHDQRVMKTAFGATRTLLEWTAGQFEVEWVA